MKKPKTWAIAAAVVLVAVLAGLLFLLPRPVSNDLTLLKLLPPGADAYALANLQELQSNLAVRKLLSDPPPISREEEYERFVRETAFRYQSDLSQLALAKLGPDWVGSARTKLDRSRMIQYLETRKAEKSEEDGKTIFTFGNTRPFRLVMLDRDLVAFTVGGDSSRIRQVLKRYSGNLADSSASEFQRTEDLRRLPAESKLWIVGRMDRMLESGAFEPRLGSFALGKNMLRGSKTLYVSVKSGLTYLEFRVEDRCDNVASAQRITSLVQAILAVLRTMPSNKSKPTPDNLTPLFASLSVNQVRDSVLIEWRWDEKTLGLLGQGSR